MNAKPNWENPRFRANMKIIELLADFFLYNPDQRFGQALVNLDIVEIKDGKVRDPFYVESEVIENRARQAIGKFIDDENCRTLLGLVPKNTSANENK